MFVMNLKGYVFAYYFFLYKSFSVECEYLYKRTITANTPTMIQTILQDMQHAFSSITNNTQVFKQMYDFETSNVDVSTLLFKLPNTDECPETETLMLMNRRELMPPTFPNLTQSYITLRRFKMSKIPINSNITKLLKIEMENILQNYVNDAWTDMGLDGWKGAIADPKVAANHKYPITVANDYPHAAITKELNKGHRGEGLQKLSTNLVFEKAEEESRQKVDKEIFIARANDPFGYSTQWQRRNTSTSTKYKRDALRLYSMIKCSTGCDPLIYKGYGCYCGFLGNGTPADGIDRCCKLHDSCYEKSNCAAFLEYFVPYVWKCFRGKPLCAIDHGEWGGIQSCAARLCNCDLNLSKCLQKFACPGRREVCRSSLSRRLQNFFLTEFITNK